MLWDLGRRESALLPGQEAVDIYRELAARQPDAFRPDLATSLHNLALWLSKLNFPRRAVSAAQESTDIHRELAARYPAAFQEALMRSTSLLENCRELLARR
jgi:hypothetical protein